MKKTISDIIAIIAFVIISVAYFFPADIDGRILFQHDTSAGVGAGQEAAAYHEATGERTRWTNSLFGGMPTYQISPSYDSTEPLKVAENIYKLFLPEYVGLAFIMMLGFYILLRAFGIPPLLSAFGGVIWAFSSYFFILISAGHLWKYATLAYIPPTIAGMVLAYRGKLMKGGIVFALFTALQIQSNHVQMTYYFLFVMIFIAVAYFADALRKKRLPQFLKASGVIVIAGLIGIAANISNLYHTYSYSKETMRGKTEMVTNDGKQKSGGLDKDYITQWSYGVGETLTLLVPNIKGGASVPLSASATAMEKANQQYSSLYGSLTQYFGDQPMTSGPVYVGAFVLFLFLAGCCVIKGPVKWALVGATLFSIILSWGKNFMPPTDFFIDFVPMYNKFRAVSSILVIAEFTIPLLAVLTLTKFVAVPETMRKEIKPLSICFALTFGVSLLVYLFPGAFTDFIPQQEAQMLQNASSQGMIPASELAGIMGNMSEMRQSLVTADAVRSMIVIALGVLLLSLMAYKKLNPYTTTILITVVCLVDLWSVDKRYLNDSQFVDKDVRTSTFTQTDADKAILEDNTLDYRVLNFTSSTFNENNTSYWHKSIGGYHAAKLQRYQDLIDCHITKEMQTAYNDIVQNGGNLSGSDPDGFKVLNMLNTRYFICPTKQAEVPVFNPHTLGNAWFVSNVKYVDNANEEMAALDDVSPRETAVVDKSFESILNNSDSMQQDSLATISLTDYQPNRLTYKTENNYDGVAVFSEIYYPDGWTATIDGQPAEIGRADYVLRTMYIPSGSHTVVMTFDPQTVHTTEAIAYTAIGLFVLAVVGTGVAEWKKRESTLKSL